MYTLYNHHMPLLKPSHGFSHRRIAATSISTRSIEGDNPNPGPVKKPAIAPILTANDLGVKSTWTHRAWVAAGSTTVTLSLAKAAVQASRTNAWVEPALAAYAGYVMADLISGVYHWGFDNYGDSSTPVFGPQFEAAQGHHIWPWTIAQREFANNSHALARGVGFFMLPVLLACRNPTTLAFVGVLGCCVMLCQQFHAWAHCTRSRLPAAVVALQAAGVLVSPAGHVGHHRPPYESHYCVVSGVWNKVLDENKVFKALEMVLYSKLGVKPRCWSIEANSASTEEEEDVVDDTSSGI